MKKRVVMFLVLAALFIPSTAWAEFREIDLSIFGMD